jgi:hypothetical protein
MTRLPVCLPRMKAVKLGLRPLKHRGYADPSTSVSVTRLEAVKQVSPPRKPLRLPFSELTAPIHSGPSASMPAPYESHQTGSQPCQT